MPVVGNPNLQIFGNSKEQGTIDIYQQRVTERYTNPNGSDR